MSFIWVSVWGPWNLSGAPKSEHKCPAPSAENTCTSPPVASHLWVWVPREKEFTGEVKLACPAGQTGGHDMLFTYESDGDGHGSPWIWSLSGSPHVVAFVPILARPRLNRMRVESTCVASCLCSLLCTGTGLLTPCLPSKIVCASGRHMLPNDLPMDFKGTVADTSFSLGEPQDADPFDPLRWGWR